MHRRLEITLEFVRSQKSNDPYSFQFGTQKYLCRDAKRQEYDEVIFDWDDHLLDRLEELQRPGVSAEVLAELGQRLTTFLGPAGIRAYENRIVDAIARGETVDIVIASSAAELYSLPWELLRLRSTGQLLGEIPRCLIRHVWPGVKPDVPETPVGRLLVGWSAAGGAVPSRAHVAGIGHAQDGHLAFDPVHDVVADISLRTLDQRIASGRGGVRALHLLCHGGVDGLAFDAADGMGKVVVDARTLQTLIAPYANDLTLVVLCACHGGDGGALGTRLGSAAQALHRAGVDAVIASRFPLSTAGSITLAETLYSELAKSGGDVRAAFLRTKRALALESGHVDHISLQLYAHENALEWPAQGSVAHEPVVDRAVKRSTGEPLTSTARSESSAPLAVSGAHDSEVHTRTGGHAGHEKRMSLGVIAGLAVAILVVCAGLYIGLVNPPAEPLNPPPIASEIPVEIPTNDSVTSDTATSTRTNDTTTAGDSKTSSAEDTGEQTEIDSQARKGRNGRKKPSRDTKSNELPPFPGTLKSTITCNGNYALRQDGAIFELKDTAWREIGNSAKSISCENAKVITHSFNDSRWSYNGTPHKWSVHQPVPKAANNCSDVSKAKGFINSAQTGLYGKGEAAQAFDKVGNARAVLKSGLNYDLTEPIYNRLQKQLNELKVPNERGCTTKEQCDDLSGTYGIIHNDLGDRYNELTAIQASPRCKH